MMYNPRFMWVEERPQKHLKSRKAGRGGEGRQTKRCTMIYVVHMVHIFSVTRLMKLEARGKDTVARKRFEIWGL